MDNKIKELCVYVILNGGVIDMDAPCHDIICDDCPFTGTNVKGMSCYNNTPSDNYKIAQKQLRIYECKSKFKQDDNVNSPTHYNIGKIEVIEAIEDWKLNFNLGNAIKYIARCEHKENKKQDLEKAKWYIERELRKCK